ncbi:hypothetical protein FB45DRAFT_1072150 [Roridomyces roridus]|uniref:F-box domain-containing protein n=1 Tax=Roridomyces roridus TaxID=1738132 RepID=A0AAD7AXD0_9AGAR|nr:hypothetical protein FB45DRAFT_1072150 [Roridomyces roridus]
MLSDEVARLSEGPARPVAHNRRVPSDCTTYLYQCRSLLSPIRRMPPEIMAHLFDISSPRLRTTQYRYICFVPLLALSQVCASWRVIILGTPTLWRSISLSWQSDNASCTTKWLTAFLNRGAQCALHLKIFNVCPAVFELLMPHSDRWRTAKFSFSEPTELGLLSAAKGRLSSLQRLEIGCAEGPDTLPLDVSKDAPNLRNLVIHRGLLLLFAASSPPLEQLQVFKCSDLITGEEVGAALDIMSHLSPASAFSINLKFGNWQGNSISRFDLPQTSSSINKLSIQVAIAAYTGGDCILGLSDILASLTLPHLNELLLDRASESNCVHIPWPHAGFMGLATRSLFHHTLQSLHLIMVAITETELLEHVGVDMHLITDTLLAKFTLPVDPDSAAAAPLLVPHLRTLECSSLLKFDDSVLLDFLHSRRPVSEAHEPFKLDMTWPEGRYRDFHPVVFARLRELRIQKQLLVCVWGTRGSCFFPPMYI